MSKLPEMFYLEPGIDTSKLRIGSVFACVFCPEFTTKDGWVIIRFQVGKQWIPHNKTWARAVAQLSKEPITEAKAEALYTALYEREFVQSR